MAPSAKKFFDRNPLYRPAEKKGALCKMAKKKPRISIPNSFFIWRISIFFFWRISIPNSFLVWRISIPNQFQKDLADSGQNSGFLMGLHKRGRTRSVHHKRARKRAHSGRTVGAQGVHSAGFSQLFCFSS